jgi:hypothetical protein
MNVEQVINLTLEQMEFPPGSICDKDTFPARKVVAHVVHRLGLCSGSALAHRMQVSPAMVSLYVKEMNFGYPNPYMASVVKSVMSGVMDKADRRNLLMHLLIGEAELSSLTIKQLNVIVDLVTQKI